MTATTIGVIGGSLNWLRANACHQKQTALNPRGPTRRDLGVGSTGALLFRCVGDMIDAPDGGCFARHPVPARGITGVGVPDDAVALGALCLGAELESLCLWRFTSKSKCSGSHIRVPVGEECLLSATVYADEYFSLFCKGTVSRLNQLEPQLATAHAARRRRRFDEGTHVTSLTLRSEEKCVELA